MSRYCVARLADLRDVIVPFFSSSHLRTSKRQNFEKFRSVIELMSLGKHLTLTGLVQIAEIAETMNHRKPSVALRILRDHTPATSLFGGEEMVRSSWRHEEAGGNVQPAAGGVVPSRGLQVTASAKFLVG